MLRTKTEERHYFTKTQYSNKFHTHQKVFVQNLCKKSSSKESLDYLNLKEVLGFKRSTAILAHLNFI